MRKSKFTEEQITHAAPFRASDGSCEWVRFAQLVDLIVVANMSGRCPHRHPGSARAPAPDTCGTRMTCARHCAHHPETP